MDNIPKILKSYYSGSIQFLDHPFHRFKLQVALER